MFHRLPYRYGRAFKRLLLINLILCFCSVLILSSIFLSMLFHTADENDAAREENILSASAACVGALDAYAQNVVLRIENSDWLYDLFIDHVITGLPLTNRTKSDISNQLSVLCRQRADVAAVSFQFYRQPVELYTSSGIFEDAAALRDLFPDALTYQFFPLEGAPAGLAGVQFDGVDYLLYRAAFRDVPGGSDKGEVNVVFQTERVAKVLREATDGRVAALQINDAQGAPLWRCQLTECAEETARITRDARAYQYQIDLPLSVHRLTARQMRPAVLWGILLVLLCGVALSLILAGLAYHPFGNILRTYVGSITPGEDEFDRLSQVIERIAQSQRQLQEAQGHLLPLGRQRMLRILLEGLTPLSEAQEAEMRSCGLVFPHPLFAVIALRAPFSTLQGGAGSAPLAMEAVQQLLPDDAQLCAYLSSDGEDQYTVLLNYRGEAELQTYVSWLSGICNEYFSRTPARVAPCLGVSLTQHSDQDICHATDQAMAALNYALLLEQGCVVFYRDIAALPAFAYDFPLSDQMRLASFLADGNAASAQRIVAYLIEKNSGAKMHDPQNLLLLYRDLYSTILRSAGELGISLPGDCREDARPDNYSQLQKLIGGQIDFVCDQIGQRRSETSAMLQQEKEMLAFIDENLFAPCLSLEYVAQRFGKSTAYISTMFKRLRGMNYVEYVNRKRVARATHLLQDQQVKVEEASAAVGYVSVTTFRRNFVKYAGQTPRAAPARGPRKDDG